MTKFRTLYEYECPQCGWIDYRAEKTQFESCVNCGSERPRIVTQVNKEIRGFKPGKPPAREDLELDRINEALQYMRTHFPPPKPPPPPKPRVPPRPQTPYEILEVVRGATVDIIKKSYRRLALRYHPDLHGGSKEMEEKFKAITVAYEKIIKEIQ